MRLHAQTALFANEAVRLPAEAFWIDEYVTELIGFPASHYAHQVDSTTHALDYMRKRFQARPGRFRSQFNT
jgi:phage terminase large subunit-like protein